MACIPNIYHFNFGFAPDFAGMPFSLVHYLAVVSCKAVNKPDAAYLYYQYEPTGLWWERTKPHVTLCKVEPERQILGTPLHHPAHVSDVFRLKTLLSLGGVYLDMDVLCLRPFETLLRHRVVMAEEEAVGLCNGVILAEPAAPFLARWLDAYATFRNEEWNHHSVVLPMHLARSFPEEIHVLGPRSFFWPMYYPEAMLQFFAGRDERMCSESFCVHLWEHLIWDTYLSALSPAHLRIGDSEFANIARAYVSEYDIRKDPLRIVLDVSGWPRNGALTVSSQPFCNVHRDFTELDAFLLEDEIVAEFVVGGPSIDVAQSGPEILCNLHRKLMPGGKLNIVWQCHSDTGGLVSRGTVDWRDLDFGTLARVESLGPTQLSLADALAAAGFHVAPGIALAPVRQGNAMVLVATK